METGQEKIPTLQELLRTLENLADSSKDPHQKRPLAQRIEKYMNIIIDGFTADTIQMQKNLLINIYISSLNCTYHDDCIRILKQLLYSLLEKVTSDCAESPEINDDLERMDRLISAVLSSLDTKSYKDVIEYFTETADKSLSDKIKLFYGRSRQKIAAVMRDSNGTSGRKINAENALDLLNNCSSTLGIVLEFNNERPSTYNSKLTTLIEKYMLLLNYYEAKKVQKVVAFDMNLVYKAYQVLLNDYYLSNPANPDYTNVLYGVRSQTNEASLEQKYEFFLIRKYVDLGDRIRGLLTSETMR